MASLDSTDINSLPMNPAMGGSNLPANIVLQKNEKLDVSIDHISQMRENDLKQMNQGPANVASHMPSALEQNTINSFITGLQQASAAGLTTLPSRDIPQMTTELTHDQEIKPNYIPTSINNNYINEHTTSNEMMQHHMRNQNKSNSIDVMYEELQVPILLAILFFMFHRWLSGRCSSTAHLHQHASACVETNRLLRVFLCLGGFDMFLATPAL